MSSKSLQQKLSILKDEDQANTHSHLAYFLAKTIPEANIDKYCKVACKSPHYAYLFIRDIPGAKIEECCEAACKDPYWAYYFAKDIPGANIEKCQDAVFRYAW